MTDRPKPTSQLQTHLFKPQRPTPSSHPPQAFVHFDCRAGGPRAWTYSLAALNHGMRALAVAKETYVRINDAGAKKNRFYI